MQKPELCRVPELFVLTMAQAGSDFSIVPLIRRVRAMGISDALHNFETLAAIMLLCVLLAMLLDHAD